MTNPTPQLHADDVKLAEEMFQSTRPIDDWKDTEDEIPWLANKISKFTTPLRLSNEALRERVKGLVITLSFCQGVMEVIRDCPADFNRDGVMAALNKIKELKL